MVARSITNLGRNGLSDWFLQRVSALVILSYIVSMLVFFAIHPHPNYQTWRSLFANLWFKVFTLLVVINLLVHSWVGLWTVFTDYVKPLLLRMVLQVAMVLLLFALLSIVLFTLFSV